MMDKDITDPSFKYAPSQNPIDPLKTSGSAALPNTMAQQVDFVPSGDDFADTIAKQTRQRIAEQTNAMNLAISKAAAGNADEAAAAQRLGYETGVGADIAARNMKALQERVAVDRIGQLDLMRADPVLAKMLSDQNFAAIAHDDVDNLQSTGTMLDSVMGVKNEFLLGRERGYATTALGKTGGKMLQDSWLGKPLLEADRAEARRQVAEMEKMRGSGGFAESFGALEGQMESGLPQQIKMAGVGAVAGGAILGLPSGGLGLFPGMVAGAELGFLSASAVQSFEIESGASFVDLLDQDIPEDTARTAATIVGTINAALEMIPLKFFTSRAKSLIKSTVQEQVVSSLVQVPGIKNAVGKFVKEWTMGIGVESVTEVVQEVTNVAAEEFAKYETDPDFQAKMTTPAGRMEVANRLLSTFEEVAKGMAVMGFIMPGANFALDAKRARKANKAKQFFKDIGKDAAASKVRERNPNSYQAWFAARAKGTGAETIYVDVDKVRGAMVRNGINQEQLQFLLPDLYKQLQAIGANSGVDVTIPTSVYAARLVDTAFGQDLQSDMRLNPDDMSINDHNEYVKTRDRRIAELVKLSDEMTASDEILAESAKVVENRVVSEIMAVGKYTELEAKAMAAAHVAFAVVTSASVNMTPDQFDIQYGMTTRGEAQAAPAAPRQVAPALSVVASDKVRAKAAEFGISESQISEAETIASSIADNDWVGLAFSDEETPREGLARAQQGMAVEQKYKDKPITINAGRVRPQDASAKVDARITTKSLEQALAEIEKVFEEHRDSIGVRFVSIGILGKRPTVNLGVQLLSETKIREELANRAKAAKQAQAAPLEQASRIDADYMAAVESGDMETAQRMVDEAAKVSEYDIVVEHQTNKLFTEFRAGELGFHVGTGIPSGMLGQITMKLRAAISNPLRMNDLGVWSAENIIYSLPESMITDRQRARLLGEIPEDMQTGSPESGDMFAYYNALAPIREFIKDAGYDGIVYRNEAEGRNDSYIAFDSEQLKSADPITRDAAGNVIPLSRRFNIASPSILEQAAISNAGPIEAAKQLVEDAGRESFNDIESFFAEKWPALLSATGKQLDLDEANFQEAAKRGISDLSKFIADNPKFADYYKKDWELTRNVLSDFYGRQITDDEFVMFRTIAGLTSPNTTLPLNISDTVNFFDWWTKNGNFDAVKLGPKPETGTLVLLEKPFSISGTTGNIKARSIKVVEELVKRFGNAVDAIEFLREMVPVGELHKFNKEMGYAGSVSNIGNIRSLVKQATGQDLLIPRMFIFGQKVGAYTLNAVGDSRYTTVDIWESRFIRSYFTGMFAKNTGLPVDSIEHDVFTRFNEVFKEEFEKETGKSWEPSALQAMRWFYIIDAAKQSGYSRASTNETISFYTERKLQKSYDYGGYGVVDSQGRSAGDGASSAGIKGQQILEQATVSATTYSALGRAVGEVTAKSLAASGWKEQIKGWVNKGIVKQSEVEWSGLVEYLDMQEGKITKETVSEFLKNNGVKVEIVTLDERISKVKRAALNGIDNAQAALGDVIDFNTATILRDQFETYRQLVQADAPRDQIADAAVPLNNRLNTMFGTDLDYYIEEEYETSGDETKYSRYVLPGGKNYREVLVTLPVGFAPPAPAMSKEGLAARQVVFDKYAPQLQALDKEINALMYSRTRTDAEAQRLADAKNEREELETQRDAEANALYRIPSAPATKPFISSHWDDKNVLVHLRMNDRTDADGKRVLFVEEVQSDWGQEGKKKGFPGGMTVAEVQQAAAADRKRFYSGKGDMSLADWTKLSERVMQWDKQEVAARQALPRAPFIETTDGWLNLGLKHVMLEAINGGYDRVAFVDGDQSVTRYKDALTEAVDEVEIDRNDDGTYNYKAIKDGKEVRAEESVTAERIEDLFGKSGGADLIEQADAFPDQINTIKSEDIKIGGEGMRKFYDDVLPAAMNKLLKKYGGEKLQQIEIDTRVPEDNSYYETLTDNDIIRQRGFDVTDTMKERVGQGLPLFQAMPSPGRRGSFDPSRWLTTLNTKADLSTFLHESSHFFFSVYTDIASRPGAPARIAADVQILLDSFGVKDIAAWNAMTFEEQRKYQEQFAYNFEIYLFEGKAPSIEMQGLFERFSKWLRRVYTDISTELNDIYRREFGEDLPILTDEIRGVMGRMLASEAQIKRAEAVNEMKPQFQTQAESGMDDARWAAYQAMIQEAHDQAVTDLTKASLRQMEWLSNARSRLLKNMQSKHDEIRKEMRAEIEAEVMAEPLYMAMSILKTGQGRAKNGELVQFNDKFKLNLEAVKKMLPSEEIAKLGYGKYGMVSEDGIPPDMVAEIVGFVSGDELVLALLTAKPAKEEIAARLDKRMMDEYGKMNTPEAREAAVQAAIHNEARERFVAVEARFIAKATQPVRVMIDAAKAAARQIVGAKKIDDISPGEYAAAEARASRDAAEAYKDRQTPDAASKSTYTRVYNEQIAKGVDEATAVAEATRKAADASTKAQGKAEAYKAKYGDRTPEQVIIRAKQAQVLQNQLVKEATSSLEEVDTAVKDFRKFFGSDEKIAKSRNMDLVDAARAILSYYGFGKVDKNPADYIKKLEAYNPELYAEIAPLISQASTGVRDYTQMTMDDFRMLRDVVDALWAQSRRDKQITVAGKKIALDGVLSELDARLNEIGVPTTVPGEKSALTTKEKFAAHLYSAKALLRRVENWADATDGAGGVGAFTKYIYRPVKDAVNAYRVDRNNYVKRFVDLVSTLDLPVGKITSPELDYTFGVGNGGNGKAELLGAMLHTGNESNYKKLLIGRKWGEFNDDESVNTSRWDAFVGRMITEGVLTKEDFDFLQAVWDLNEEIKPIAQRAHRDLYGYYFKEVEATSFTNRFGTYRGGYVPAKTDAAIVRDAQRQAKAEELEADFRSSMPSTGMGFTKGRVEYNKPLSLDVRLMAKHIDDVLRFAHIQPAIKDALRIVNNRAFADKLSSIDPTAVEFMLLPWLNRTARQSTNEPGRNKVIDNFWRTLRSRTGMSIMFANLRNALQQVTGLFPSALKVSKGALKDSLFAYLASPRKTAEAIAGLSPFMNERMHSQIFEIQDQMNDLLLNPSKFDKIQKWSQHHGYFLQSAFQNFVDIVTWNGKYNQVLSEIGTTLSDSEAQAEAIQQADAAVRSTQGSMSAEDVAAFEVGSPFYKTFVQFTGYFNMLANLNTDEYVKVLRDLGWRGNKGKLVSIYMLGFLAPTLVADAIARSLGAGWDDDDDGYLDDVADWFFGSQVRAGAAMVPFGSTAYTAFAAGFTARTYDDRITSSPSIGSLEASTVGVGKAVVNLASDDKELTGRNVRDVLTLITNATGVPVSVLGRPIGYQMEVNRGKVEPTNPLDYMRGLITSVPSAESKKK